jgi:hypothetical protein
MTLADSSNRGDSKPQSRAWPPHAEKRRSVKIAISGPKAKRAIRRSFHVMPDTGLSANGIKKRKAAHARAASSPRKRRLTPSRHRRHDRLLAKCGLVITGQFFGSLRHLPDWQGFAVGASSIER